VICDVLMDNGHCMVVKMALNAPRNKNNLL
jgi:hypothetical protein